MQLRPGHSNQLLTKRTVRYLRRETEPLKQVQRQKDARARGKGGGLQPARDFRGTPRGVPGSIHRLRRQAHRMNERMNSRTEWQDEYSSGSE